MSDLVTLGVLAVSVLMAAPRAPTLPPVQSIQVIEFLPLTSEAAISRAMKTRTRVLYEWTTLEPDWEIVQAMLWPSIAPSIALGKWQR